MLTKFHYITNLKKLLQVGILKFNSLLKERQEGTATKRRRGAKVGGFPLGFLQKGGGHPSILTDIRTKRRSVLGTFVSL
jgi:hypothetical protein